MPNNVSEWRARLSAAPVALDGGFATALEARGHDLSGQLWSARLLVEDPAEVVAVHRAYVEAGADVISTASYQTSRIGFERAGLSADAADTALRDSVRLARTAADGAAFVAASIGPYGAMLADGSEYRGDYTATKAELRDFHRTRLAVIADAEPDLLAFETVPSLAELEVINDLLAEEFNGLPAWVSVSARSAQQISDGTDIAQAFAALTAESVVAVGINCTKPEFITGLLTAAAPDRPVAVYPNAGRTWDAAARAWLDTGTDRLPAGLLADWLANGVRLLGGCCGLGYEHVRDVAELLRTNKDLHANTV